MPDVGVGVVDPTDKGSSPGLDYQVTRGVGVCRQYTASKEESESKGPCKETTHCEFFVSILTGLVPRRLDSATTQET